MIKEKSPGEMMYVDLALQQLREVPDYMRKAGEPLISMKISALIREIEQIRDK